MKDYNKKIIKLNGNVNVLSKDEELLKLSRNTLKLIEDCVSK